MDEFEIDWIPEEDSSSVIEDLAINIPAHTIDKMCKQKYGHTNWAGRQMSRKRYSPL